MPLLSTIKIALQKAKPIVCLSSHFARLLITYVLSLLCGSWRVSLCCLKKKKMLIGSINETVLCISCRNNYAFQSSALALGFLLWPTIFCLLFFPSPPLQSSSHPCETKGLKMDECFIASSCSVNSTLPTIKKKNCLHLGFFVLFYNTGAFYCFLGLADSELAN